MTVLEYDDVIKKSVDLGYFLVFFERSIITKLMQSFIAKA